MRVTFASLLSMALVFTGCGGDDDGGGGDRDAGGGRDSGGSGMDSGGGETDSGGGEMDSGGGEMDSGPFDAGPRTCEGVESDLRAERAELAQCMRSSQCGVTGHGTCPEGGCYEFYATGEDLSDVR